MAAVYRIYVLYCINETINAFNETINGGVLYKYSVIIL